VERKYRQGFVREIPEDKENRTITFVISDDTRDRHKSVIPSDAWDLKSFTGNPVAGWSHEVYGRGLFTKPDPDNFIGRWDNLRFEGNEMLGDLTFEDKETNPLAEKLLRKVRNGTLNAVSVGFLPGDGHYGEKEAEENRGGKNETYYYDSAELVEASLVGIGSNKNAKQVSKALLENTDDIPELIREIIREALGDKFNEDDFEKLTIRGLFTTLRGGEAAEIETAETGDEVDVEARRKRLHKIKAINSYLDFKEEHKNGD